MAPRKKVAAKVQEDQELEQSAAVSDRLPVWEGGESRSEYLSRAHQFRIDHNLGPA